MTGALPAARIRLLGRFSLELDGAPAPPLDSARSEALLAHLLLHSDAAIPRPLLAARFWPDSGEGQSRTNLRHLLHLVRTRLPDLERHVEITPRSVRWRTEVPYQLDVQDFRRLVASAGAGRRESLRAASDLYRGDLLEGHDDEWLSEERSLLRHQHVRALADLSALCAAVGDVDEAVAVAERLLRADPLREATYRELMQLHAARGDRARAVRVYHDCSSTLERELGVPPSPQTRAAYAEVLPTRPAGPAAEPASRSTFVGRTAERRLLSRAWRSAETGHARFVLVHGEAGIGKSRLVEELLGWCARRGAVVAEARCFGADRQLAYGPVAAWLRSPGLRSRLPMLGLRSLRELMRLLPELHDELPGLDRPAPLPEAEQRRRLLEAIAAGLLTPGVPVILVVDDLHHADRQTCEVVHYLLHTHPAARLLIVATARWEEVEDAHPVWGLLTELRARQRCVEVELTPLNNAETIDLAERLLGTSLPTGDARTLWEETEGSPLFVVEAVRAGWTTGRPLSRRVQAVIQARLDQLRPPARELVEVAALIGREFRTGVLEAAAMIDDDTVVTGLDELWRRRIVRERGMDGYGFSHDKIREVAATGVPPARRRQLHLRIAAALETAATPGTSVDRGELSEEVSAEIAAHHEGAGAAEQAAAWYARAAEAAQLLHAGTDALELLRRALEQLHRAPASRQRDAAELTLRTARLAPLTAAHGYASPELLSSQRHAETLTSMLGVAPSPTLLRSLAMSALTRGDFVTAGRLGHDLQVAGEGAGENVLVVEGAFVRGVTSFWQADLPAARAYLELAVRRYRREDRHAHLLHYGNDPKVACLARLGNTMWFLGHPEAARAARAEAVAWAEEIDHCYSRGIAAFFGALLALDMGDERLLRQEVAALSTATESPQLELGAAALHGYLAVRDGAMDEGLIAIRAAIERGHGHEAPGLEACLRRVLLAGQVAAGDTTGALGTVGRLLSMGGGARVWATEARRVRRRLAHEA